jgi:O-antigen/teichoic acid export membrane protein
VGDVGPDALEAVSAEAAVPAARRGPSVSAQSRAVVAWKTIEYAGLFGFVVLMPRLMRPDLYGRFAALIAVIGLLTMAAAMGAQATFGRFVPEFETTGARLRTRVLFTQLFLLRFTLAAALAVGLFLAFPHLRTDASSLTAALGAGAFFCVALAMVCFQLFYGLNQLGRSMAHDGLLRLALIGLVLLLGGQRDLDRAALALLLTEVALLALGLAWARGYFIRHPMVRDFGALREKLAFGFSFFGANLLHMAIWRGGEFAVLLLTGKSAEVAFYSVANAVTVAFAALLGQLGNLLVPSLTAFHVAGDSEHLDSWLGLSLKYLTITAVGFVLVVHALGGWLVETLLGEEYLPVVAALKILSLSLLPVALVRAGLSVAMVRLESGRAVQVAAGGLATFLLAAAFLVPAAGSAGASVSAALAVGATGALAAVRFALGPVLRVAGYGRLALAGAAALLSFLLPWSDLLAGAVALPVFISLLFALKVVSAAELRRMAAAFAA